MGLDSIIDNDKEYKSTLNYILINSAQKYFLYHIHKWVTKYQPKCLKIFTY